DGAPLDATRRLAVGDEYTFFGTRIAIGEAAGELLIEVHLEDSVYVTRAPEVPGETAVDDEQIAPAAFRRAAETAAAPVRHGWRGWQLGVGMGIAALLFVSWLLFSSRSIQFLVEPGEPDHFSISGGWFTLPVGNRVLMRPG